MKREVLLEYLHSGAARESLAGVYGADADAAAVRLLEDRKSVG